MYTEFSFNFKTSVLERVHVNATTPAGLEMEFDITLPEVPWFDITLPEVPCAALSIGANDPTGQSQSLHLDHVGKHRLDKEDNWIKRRLRLELGNTLLSDDHLAKVVEKRMVRVYRMTLMRKMQPPLAAAAVETSY